MWHHWVMVDDLATMRVALQKPLVHRMLDAAGLPVPEHVAFKAGDLAPALAFLEQAGGPFVVKAAGASGGSGTTCGVRTPAQLRRARLRARRLADDLLMERQVAGDNYRFLFLEGQLLDIIRRHPPTVTGDGEADIVDLVARENRHRLDAVPAGRRQLLKIDLEAVFTLEAAGLTLASVPPAGTRVPVKTVVSQNGPQDNESVRGAVSEALIRDAALAARVTGVRLAGIDLITPDVAVGLAEAGGAVLEVNSPPGLHYHYDIRNPDDGVAVATPILHRLLAGEPAFPLIDLGG
jgi:D-alanine-D-alanine ligase-like ATP-grasp enzyme